MTDTRAESGRLYCPRCTERVGTSPHATLLGFPRHHCPTCEFEFFAPLPRLAWLAWAGILLAGYGGVAVLAGLGVMPLAAAMLPVGFAAVGALVVHARLGRGHAVRGRTVWLVHLARRTAQISAMSTDRREATGAAVGAGASPASWTA